MKNSNTVLQDVLNELNKNPYDLIRNFQAVEVPENDSEYLNYWLKYLGLKSEVLKSSRQLLTYDSLEPELIKFHSNKYKAIIELLDKSLQEKIEHLDFNPNMDRYLSKFKEDERPIVRLIILSYCDFVLKDSIYNNLFDFCEKFDVDLNYILSLDQDHPLFADGIFIISQDGLNEDKNFYSKDLIFKTAVYKLFANMPFTDDDAANLFNSPLLDFFGIEHSYFSELHENSNEILNRSKKLATEDEEYNLDTEPIDFENLLKEEDGEQLTNGDVKGIDESALESSFESYFDNLDYLHTESKWIGRLIDLRKTILDEGKYADRPETEKKLKLQSEILKHQNISKIRLEKSIESGFIPRLERIADKLGLSEFERKILKVLVVNRTFPNDKSFSSFDYPEIKELLFILVEDPQEQVRNKKYFFLKSKLVKSNLIHVDLKDRLDSDLFNAEVKLDNRLIEYLLGEDYDISNFIDYSNLYQSKIDFEQVVLSKEIKQKVLSYIENFPLHVQARKEVGFDELVEYGNALTFLFVGPSGTGKTMLANAISNKLRKKILLFDFNNYEQVSTYLSSDNVFPMLFREARMNDAILFFDESEVLLENRFNDLLIEIEKHEGIVIFATNAEFRMKEAMKRRINNVIQFKNPGPSLRKEIWRNHFPKKLKLSKDIDLDLLARRFELNGGLIKNAISSAFNQAVNDQGRKNPLLKMKYLENGAREQLQNKLFMSNLKEDKVPRKSMDSVVQTEGVLGTLNEIINIDKAKKVLEGEWGFSDTFPGNNGIAVLFYGPSGTGKTLSAEAVAYETGKNLKVINYAQIVDMYVGNTEKNLEELFKEVASQDDILLFDEADALFATRSAVNSSNDRYANLKTDVLLSLIEQYNTFAILTTNHIDNIDRAFFRRIQYIVKFDQPDEVLRRKLWETLIPSKLPIAGDVNIKVLAKKYEFNGGDIKNVVFRAATKRAISLKTERVVSMSDLVTISDEIMSNKGNGVKKVAGFISNK